MADTIPEGEKPVEEQQQQEQSQQQQEEVPTGSAPATTGASGEEDGQDEVGTLLRALLAG